MEMLNMPDLVEEYSRLSSKYCIYASLRGKISVDELKDLADFIKERKIEVEIKNFFFSLRNCEVIFIFDTEKEMLEFYDELEDKTCVYITAYLEGKLQYES